MDPTQADLDAIQDGSELKKTRLLVVSAAVAGPVVVTLVGIASNDGDEIKLLLGGGVWILQVVLGIAGFVVGRRAAERIDKLRLPVASAHGTSLRRWAAAGIIIAVLGLAGVLLSAIALVVFLVMGVLLGGAMLGGAWGRPLRVGGKNVGATLGCGRRWAEGPRPAVDDLDATTRAALGRMWLHDATKEHGSVPAFAQLSWGLAALGAPADLLARASQSTLQEVDHAKRCFAVSETYLDVEIGVGPIAAVAPRLPTIRRPLATAKAIALETLEDGCLIEGVNADFAERAHALARDPAMVELTGIIAREEREHAELAWDILRFCIDLHPSIAAAVERRLQRLPQSIALPYTPETLALTAAADPDQMTAHGRVPFDDWEQLFATRRAATIERARALLAALRQRPTPQAAVASRGL